MSLMTILGTDDPTVIAAYLRDNYVNNTAETARRSHAKMLDDFFAGKGDDEMRRVIDLLWTDPKNAARRKAVLAAGLDKSDNILARIAKEKATVYSEPAQRKVANETNETYQRFGELLPQDAVMRALDVLLAIHDEALLWYRVRIKPTGEREPVLECVSPANFWAVCHPNDRTMLVAIIMDQRMPMSRPEDPTYRVWTDDDTFVMNAKCEIMGAPEAWPYGRMPGVLCSMVEPSAKGRLLTECPSIDLLSAQKAVRLQNLNLTKESISASKQTYVTGDISTATMGQSADTDGEVMLPEGVTASSIDRGVDTDQFIDNANHAADAAGANHGVPPTVRSQKDASSGAEIEFRRLPLRELRMKRIPVFRRIEAAIARIMAMVNGARIVADDEGEPMAVAGDLQDFAFSVEGWSIDFGEVQQPMTEMESLQVFEKARELGIRDNYEEEMRRNPDIRTLDEAKAIVDERMARRTDYVVSMKEYMAASGALGAAQPATPFEANRGEPRDDEPDTARFEAGA